MSASVTPLRGGQSIVATIRQHTQEANRLSAEYADDLARDLASIATRCLEAASLESLPPGVRDLARREAERLTASAATINHLNRRT